MRGYFNDEEATKKAFPAPGWFDTGSCRATGGLHACASAAPLGLTATLPAGDLGWRAPHGVRGSKMAGNVVITGRAKDTLVLSSGENIEPQAGVAGADRSSCCAAGPPAPSEHGPPSSQPLEDLLQASAYIAFAVLLGAGHRALGALIVPDRNALTGKPPASGCQSSLGTRLDACAQAGTPSCCCTQRLGCRTTGQRSLTRSARRC